jgi:hypothetical protein
LKIGEMVEIDITSRFAQRECGGLKSENTQPKNGPRQGCAFSGELLAAGIFDAAYKLSGLFRIA